MKFDYKKVREYVVPNIELSPKNKNINLGKYGRLREKYLKENKPSVFNHLLMSEELTSHLARVENEANEYEELLIKQIANKEKVNENLKEINQIQLVQKMNNIKNRAEEIVLNELIYN